jgi:L-ascorbate metabolism protein UlaG (beta-lactamase superfamily)
MTKGFLLRGTTSIFLSVVMLLSVLIIGPAPAPTTALAADQGTVTLEWLGHMFFRLTAPDGTVVLTTPYLQNPDAPIGLEGIDRADVILIPNGHGDDKGQVLEVAAKTGGTVVAPSALGDWLVEQGLDRDRLVATGTGSVHELSGVRIRTVQNIHDERISGTPNTYGGAVGYIITFSNGFTVYFAASSDITMDMQLYGRLYKPHVALLNASGRDPATVAAMVELIATDNPNLHTVFPIHIRMGDPIIQRIATEVRNLGLSAQVMEAPVGLVYTY